MPKLENFPVSEKDAANAAAENAEHEKELAEATFEDVKAAINVADKSEAENPEYDPLKRLEFARRNVEAFSGSEEEKAELQRLFDQRALELLKDTINVGDKSEAENPEYDPLKRLEFSLGEALKFPLFDESLREELRSAAAERKEQL